MAAANCHALVLTGRQAALSFRHVLDKSSGNTRVSATVVMKLVSPGERGENGHRP
jgi:hypothetical protein